MKIGQKTRKIYSHGKKRGHGGGIHRGPGLPHRPFPLTVNPLFNLAHHARVYFLTP